jgi:hypothetical protein
MHEWRTWWGGMTRSESPPQIAEMFPKLRKLIGGLKAEKKAGVQFAIKSAKDLLDKVHAATGELDMVTFVTGQNVTNIDVERGTACMVQSQVRVGCPDGSYVDFCGVGHGVATDDKAAGKGSTYSWKDAWIKIGLPDKELVDTDDSSDERPVRRAAGTKTTVSGDRVKEARLWLHAKERTPEEVTARIDEWLELVETDPDFVTAISADVKLAKARLGLK